MITPIQSHDELLRDIEHAKKQPNALHVWWLGQSGFLVQWAGHHLLFDPYLSDSLTKKYANTDKPHVRMTELAIPPERLEMIDVVTSSHNHTDHLDAETLCPLMNANPDIVVVVPAANVQFAADRLKVSPDRLTPIDPTWKPIECGPFQLSAVPAAHEQVETDDEGHCKYIGIVARCGGRYSIYHSGDTMLYDGMIDVLRPHQIDLALLPINGRRPERRVAGNLFGKEAANLAKAINAKRVVPCHYEMFEFNTESPDEFVSECKTLGQPYSVLRCGERLTING